MITTINEYKNNFNINEHIMGYLFNYGNEIHSRNIVSYLNENNIFTKENFIQLKESLISQKNIYEKKETSDFDKLKEEEEKELEEIDSEEYEVDKIVDIFTDMEEVKESVGTGLSSDMQPKTIERGDTIYLTALLKPRNKSIAYAHGEMGVIKVKVQQTWYGLNKLNNLKKRGLLYN